VYFLDLFAYVSVSCIICIACIWYCCNLVIA